MAQLASKVSQQCNLHDQCVMISKVLAVHFITTDHNNVIASKLLLLIEVLKKEQPFRLISLFVCVLNKHIGTRTSH